MLEIKEENGKIFSFIRDKWVVATPEERVRQKIVCRLVNHYEYSVSQMDEELKVSNSKRGQGKARADIVIWKSKKDKDDGKNAFIVVECKADNITIKKEDYFQGCNYARWAGADFFVTSNEKETNFFRVNQDKMPTELDEIIDIPSAKEVGDDKRIKEILSQLKTFQRDEFAKLLHKCHNIIRNNDKLSPEAAFDEISKILFIKIRYERESTVGAQFSKEQFEKDEKFYESQIKPGIENPKDSVPYMQYLFRLTKQAFEKDHLFDSNETIKIRQNSFTSIVKELEKYNLSNTSDDVKGIAFEKFLGTTFRGELGQFFTPRTIVDYMVEILDPKEGETICDPCCGSGGFLIRAFEYVREAIERDIKAQKDVIKEKYKDNPEAYDKLANDLNKELEVSNPESRVYSLSRNSIYGTDANPRMARVSKMNMIMHGDGHGGVHHHDGLLNVNGIFEGHFDVILTNPPFGAQVKDDVVITQEDMQNQAEIKAYIEKYGEDYKDKILTKEDLNKAINKRFQIGSKLTEVLFIERCLNLLKKGGRMGIVLPEGVLNGANLQKCRDYVEGKAKIILITSIPQDVFIAAGATVKPSLVFFKKFTEEEELQYNSLKKEIENELNTKYKEQIDALSTFPKKELKAKIKELDDQKDQDAKKILKERFNYQIPIAEVEFAGINTTGQECENQLKDVLKEFKTFNSSNTQQVALLKYVAYASLKFWDIKRISQTKVSSLYPIVKLGDVIQEENKKIKLSDDPEKEFKILGVNNQIGLFDAYIEKGKNINQPYKKVENGFFAYNPYRVNVGSIGLKTEKNEYEYISPAYVVFSCKKELLPNYLFILLKTNLFNKKVNELTTGSVRQTLSFNNLKELEIPLPPLDKQKTIIESKNILDKEIEAINKRMLEFQYEFEKEIFS